MRTLVGVLLLVLCLLGRETSARAMPEDAETQRLREKLDSLRDVLQELNNNLDEYEGEESVAEKRQVEDEPAAEDTKLLMLIEVFQEKLTDEDRALLKSMNSRAVYLKNVLGKDPAQNPGDDEIYDEEWQSEPMKRQMESSKFDQLSSDDQELLKHYPAMLKAFNKAAEKPTHSASQEMEEPAELMKRGEGNFEDFVDDLSQQDQQFIQDHPSFLDALKIAADKPTHTEDDEMSSDVQARNCRCAEEKRGEHCRCNDENKALQEVEQKFLDDVKYAKKRGITLRELIDSLASKKREFQSEDQLALERLGQ